MDKPCKYCDLADNRETPLKCDKPCEKGEAWWESMKRFRDVFNSLIIKKGGV